MREQSRIERRRRPSAQSLAIGLIGGALVLRLVVMVLLLLVLLLLLWPATCGPLPGIIPRLPGNLQPLHVLCATPFIWVRL